MKHSTIFITKVKVIHRNNAAILSQAQLKKESVKEDTLYYPLKKNTKQEDK